MKNSIIATLGLAVGTLTSGIATGADQSLTCEQKETRSVGIIIGHQDDLNRKVGGTYDIYAADLPNGWPERFTSKIQDDFRAKSKRMKVVIDFLKPGDPPCEMTRSTAALKAFNRILDYRGVYRNLQILPTSDTGLNPAPK